MLLKFLNRLLGKSNHSNPEKPNYPQTPRNTKTFNEISEDHQLKQQEESVIRRRQDGLVPFSCSDEMLNTFKKRGDDFYDHLLRCFFAAIQNIDSSPLNELFNDEIKQFDHNAKGRLDVAFRQKSSEYIWHQHHQFFLELASTSSSEPVLYCLSMLGNGFVREKAVERFGSISSSGKFAMELYLMRVNDWAIEISTVAQQQALELVKKIKETELATTFPSLIHLHRCKRHSLNNFIGDLSHLYSQRISDQFLKEKLSNSDSPLDARAVAEFLWKSKEKLSDSILTELLTTSDPFIRFFTLKHTIPTLPNDIQEQLVLKLPSTKWIPARMERLRILQSIDSAYLHEELIKGLLDPSTSIRQFSRFYLRKEGTFNIEEHYLTTLEQMSYPTTALRGLSECSPEEAQPYIEAWLKSKDQSKLIAALTVCTKESAEKFSQQIVESLQIPNSQLQRAAYLAAKRIKAPELFQPLVWDKDTSLLTKMFALKLSLESEHWASLYTALCCTLHHNPNVKEYAIKQVNVKTQRSHSIWHRPSTDTTTKIFCQLEQAKAHISPETYRELRFLLKTED